MKRRFRPLRTYLRRRKLCECYSCQGRACGKPANGGPCILERGHPPGCVFWT